MATLNLEDDNVRTVEISVDEARKLDFEHEALATALDEAQAPVFGGDAQRSYLVVVITPNTVAVEVPSGTQEATPTSTA